jgi:hypothetical protein
MDTFRSTETSPRPQSKGKERAIISREYPPDTVWSVAHASPANGDRFQAFGEGGVSADQTAAGAPAELEPQIGKHTFDDNPGDTFSASETAAGAATQGEKGEDGGNAVSRDDANRMFPAAAPRQEPCQNIDNDVIIPFAGTTNIQSIDQTDRSSAPIDCWKSSLRLTIVQQLEHELPFKSLKIQRLLVDQLPSTSRRLPGPL